MSKKIKLGILYCSNSSADKFNIALSNVSIYSLEMFKTKWSFCQTDIDHFMRKSMEEEKSKIKQIQIEIPDFIGFNCSAL